MSISFAGFTTEFKNLGHQIATVAEDFVNFVKNDLDPILSKVEAEEPIIESITAVLSPQAEAIEKAAFFALGQIGQAFDGVSAATAAKGVNVVLDQAAYTTLTNAIALVKANVVTTVAAVKAAPVVPVTLDSVVTAVTDVIAAEAPVAAEPVAVVAAPVAAVPADVTLDPAAALAQ